MKNQYVGSDTPPCVRSKRLRVYQHHVHMRFQMWTWCWYTRRRFERTHGGVGIHIRFFQRATPHTREIKHTQQHTTTTQHYTTLHNTTQHTTSDKKEKENEKEKREERRERENRLQLQPSPFGESISSYSYSRASAGELILDYSYRRALSRNLKCNNYCANGTLEKEVKEVMVIQIPITTSHKCQ